MNEETVDLKIQSLQHDITHSIRAMARDLHTCRMLIVKLKSYGFECEAGPLEHCVEFTKLNKLLGGLEL